MPHLRTKILAAAVAILFTATVEQSIAQVRNAPAPTGQVPRSAAGQRPFAGYQPKPTGQIAPASSVQVSGAPVTSQPAQAALPGQVPKVNSNQDPRTFPERYQPDAVPQQEIITNLETQFIQQQQQNPAGTTTTTTVPTEQTSTVTTTPGQQQSTTATPAQQSTTSTSTTTQTTPSRSASQIPTSTQPQTQQPANAPAASPRRVDPR